MERRDSGALSLDAIMREVREVLDRPPDVSVKAVPAPAQPPRKNTAKRIVEAIAGRFRRGA